MYNSFQYKDAEQLQGLPIQGRFDAYEGDGYVYEMRGQLSYLQGNLSLLKKMNWIDRQTRAVFAEFTTFNPNIRLVMVSSILVEFLPSGSILTTARFDPLNLFSETGRDLFSFKTVCEILFLIFVVYFMLSEIKESLKIGVKKYMTEFWNYVELAIIISAWISFGMLVMRMKTAQEVLDFFKQTGGYGYIKLQKVNESNETLIFSLGLCASLSTLKIS